MKRQTRFFIRQTAQLDSVTVKIFRLTHCVVSFTLLLSLGLLISASLLNDRTAAIQLADGLFHAVFRIAAVGTVAGFAADIAVKRKRR